MKRLALVASIFILSTAAMATDGDKTSCDKPKAQVTHPLQLASNDLINKTNKIIADTYNDTKKDAIKTFNGAETGSKKVYKKTLKGTEKAFDKSKKLLN